MKLTPLTRRTLFVSLIVALLTTTISLAGFRSEAEWKSYLNTTISKLSNRTTSTSGLTAASAAPAPVMFAGVMQLGSASSQLLNTGTLSGFTASAGTDRLLVVTASDSNATDVTTVTFGGTPMTQVVEQNDGSIAVDSIWILKLGSNASSTTGNIVMTSNAVAVTHERYISAVVFENVDQTTPTSNPMSSSATGGNSSLMVGSAAGDLVYDVFDTFKGPMPAPTLTLGGGQTQVTTANSSITGGPVVGGVNTSANGFGTYANSSKPGAASVTMSWTSNAEALIHCAINLKQSTGASPSCSITCPANITVPNTPGQCNAQVTYPAPMTTGSCGTVTTTPASGSFFPVGITTVTATTTAGATCQFTVTVQDTQAPTLTCPANITVPNTPGSCNAVVTFPMPMVSDNCPGATVMASPASGSTFPVGITTVTVTAKDASPFSPDSMCTFTVTVQDMQPPVLSGIPANKTFQCLTDVPPPPNVTATDNCPGVLTPTFSETQSGTCPLTITRTWRVLDAAGNSAAAAQTITVQDTIPPVLVGVPSSNATFQCLADVPSAPNVTATDNCDVNVTLTFTETRNGTCPLTITRTWQAVDACGNSATATRTITVRDTIPPVLSGVPADVMVNSLADVPTPATVTATDNCDITLVPTLTETTTGTCPSKIFRTWVAKDACGNSAAATQTITVNNSQPSITDPVNVNLLQGGTATFSVTATGSPAPAIQWQVSTDGGANFANIPSATGATLTIPNVTPALNNNRYRAIASNECGTATSRAALLNVSGYDTKFADPLACLAGGDLVTINGFITNNGPDAINATYSVTNLAPNLVGIPGSGIASVSPANFVVTATTANWNGTLQPGETVNFTFKAQLAASVAQGSQVCIRSTAAINNGTPVVLNPCTIVGCPPGGINPTLSSQKPGSLLVFPYHTSKSATKADTRITITNVGERFAYVHLFFIDGVSCQQSDMYLCLTPNASFSGRASEFDPETTGWILAVAVNQQGVPIQLNQLIGNAFVTDGDYVDTYGAETFAARLPQVAVVQDNTALLFLDGVGYDAVANQFAVELQSPVTAPNQRIVTVGLRGDLNASTMRGAAQVGTGLVINGNEQPIGSFTGWLNGNCQAINPITNTSPRVPLGMNGMIPAGQVGTMQFRITAGVGLIMTPRTSPWSGIRPLHKTGLTTATIRIPIFVPVC